MKKLCTICSQPYSKMYASVDNILIQANISLIYLYQTVSFGSFSFSLLP